MLIARSFRRVVGKTLDAHLPAFTSFSMPKVAVTAKKARKVLSLEPLVPASVQTLTETRRRSSRLAGAEKTSTDGTSATLTSKDADKASAVVSAHETKAEQARGSRKGKADNKGANVNMKAANRDEKAHVSERPKKRRKSAKTEPLASNVEIKVEEKSGNEVAASDKDAATSQKPRKNRRAPAGFAVRGEHVDDSAAARRARLKAAAKGSDMEPGQVPKALGDDIQRMCHELGNQSLGRTAPWEKGDGVVGGNKWWVGCHVSTSGGLERAVINAAAVGCRAFAMDTRCKMRWESPPLTDETVAAFKKACQQFGFGPEQILPHGSYLINLASPDPEMAKKGYGGFLTELQRCERLGLTMYNFHPGSTTGLCTHEESMDRIAGFVNEALAATKGVTIVLENMSSVGNIVGGRLWHLRYIIDRVADKSRIGFCIDTCHLFSSGMDLRTEEACEKTFREIDDVIGFKYLKGMHINDSKTPFDSHKDRHENIGRGSIPMTAFRWIMNNPAFQGIPLIMETPVQEREPPVNYKKSLELGNVVWKDLEGPYGVGTDRRDVILLNSLIES